MRRLIVLGVAALGITSASLAATPTIDGVFDGAGVWGTPFATNATPGWAGMTAANLYVTSDTAYAYFGCEVNGMGTWQSYGFAIDSITTAGTPNGTQEPWTRQINLNFPADFVVRGNCDDGWRELRTWNGSGWDGGGTDIGSSEARCVVANNWIECRVSRTTLGIPSFFDLYVEFFGTGDQSAHGTFTSCPTDQICTAWNQSPANTLSNPVFAPVALSAFTIE
jgi:hypothetical protein